MWTWVFDDSHRPIVTCAVVPLVGGCANLPYYPERLITLANSGTILSISGCNSVKSGGPTSTFEHYPRQFHGWNRTESLVWMGHDTCYNTSCWSKLWWRKLAWGVVIEHMACVDNECNNREQTKVLYIWVYNCTISIDVIEMLIECIQGTSSQHLFWCLCGGPPRLVGYFNLLNHHIDDNIWKGTRDGFSKRIPMSLQLR